MSVERASHQKHLGIYLDEKLNFKMHIDTVSCKVNKGISVIKRLRHTLPRKPPLLTIYKAFLRPHGNIIYDQPSNEPFCEKLELVHSKATLAITGAIQGTSRKKNLESLKSRSWFRRLCCTFEIIQNQSPEYLNNLIPKPKQNFNSRNIYIPSYNCQTEYFKSPFFFASLAEWFHLDLNIRHSETINAFKQKLLPFIHPLENSIFKTFDPEGLKLLTC